MRKVHDPSNFLSARQKIQLVAAEVRRQAEDAAKRARKDEEKRKGRRDRLRVLYRKHIPEEGLAVDFDEVRNLVEGIASTTYGAWRRLAELDHIAMADSAEREDFDQLEFLVNRALCELIGVKNIVTLARRLA